MAKIADLAFKTTTGFLGVCTMLFGANLLFNTARGMAWHLENSSRTVTVTERPVPATKTPEE